MPYFDTEFIPAVFLYAECCRGNVSIRQFVNSSITSTLMISEKEYQQNNDCHYNIGDIELNIPVLNPT